MKRLTKAARANRARANRASRAYINLLLLTFIAVCGGHAHVRLLGLERGDG